MTDELPRYPRILLWIQSNSPKLSCKNPHMSRRGSAQNWSMPLIPQIYLYRVSQKNNTSIHFSGTNCRINDKNEFMYLYLFRHSKCHLCQLLEQLMSPGHHIPLVCLSWHVGGRVFISIADTTIGLTARGGAGNK